MMKQNFALFTNLPDCFSLSSITETELYLALSRMKSTSAGVDGISVNLLKIVYPFISRHLLYFINFILTSSKYPNNWKISRVVPIPKSGRQLSLNNMRPISILPSMSKIVEFIMKEQITKWIESKGLLNECQYGFRRGRNTGLLLTCLTDTIRKFLNEGKVSVVVSVDLSKAFDLVDHSCLVKKLNSKFGFAISACRFIWSYLSGREQIVSLNGLNSEALPVRSGVPQGSVIGPILFTLFLNDLFDELNFCKPFVFADDIQLLWSGEFQLSDVLQATINHDLSSLSNWMQVNKFSVNPDKTKAIVVRTNRSSIFDLDLRMSGTAIEITNEIRCLGVIIDDKLSFESHVNVICSRVCQTLH